MEWLNMTEQINSTDAWARVLVLLVGGVFGGGGFITILVRFLTKSWENVQAAERQMNASARESELKAIQSAADANAEHVNFIKSELEERKRTEADARNASQAMIAAIQQQTSVIQTMAQDQKSQLDAIRNLGDSVTNLSQITSDAIKERDKICKAPSRIPRRKKTA